MERREFLCVTGSGLAGLAAFSTFGRALAQGAEETVRIEKGARAEFPSPSGNLLARIFVDAEGRLVAEVEKSGKRVVEIVGMGLIIDELDFGQGMTIEVARTGLFEERYPTRGHHWEAVNRYRWVTLQLLHSSRTPAIVECRLFDDGFAYRFGVKPLPEARVQGENTTFTVPEGSRAFFQTDTRNYEGIWRSARAEELAGVIAVPITFKLPGTGDYLLLSEAALYNFSGMSLLASGRSLKTMFLDDKWWIPRRDQEGRYWSPWRVAVVADLNGIVNSDLIPNLNPPPDPKIFSGSETWIHPGRALWSWWSEGTGNPALARKYIEAAQKLGFEYILIDEGWEYWGMGIGKWEALAGVVAYARERKVKVWVWKHWGKLKSASYRDQFLAKVKETGVVGVKIDFMDSESKERIDFYESALADAGRYQLMVNFHGANKPTGEFRTYPNEMTREGIRGLEYNRSPIPLPASHNVIFPFTRAAVGHADYTPVTFNPRKMGNTTFCHQLAMPMVVLSPLTHWADRPENYLENPKTAPALEIIKALPTVWDQTIVLPASEPEVCAAFARRRDKTWFLGIMNGEEKREVKINLDFLGPGTFSALLLSDVAGVKDQFARAELEVNAASQLELALNPGGGAVAMIRPLP